MTTDKALGLYIHLPFCRRRCAYCDFCSYVGREDEIPAYVTALCRELCERARPDRVVDTVYLGGGTPSLLPTAELARLLDAVGAHCRLASGAEITCEANPGTADYEKFSLLKAAGVNRLSLGVQSLSDRALRALGRIHTAKEAVAAYDSARRAGFRNLSLDLMTGLPGETPAELLETLRGVLALAPEHISAYSLILEEGTPLAASPLRHEIPDDDAAADAMEMTAAVLEGAGSRRYEISNYAREGYESRHNLRYWRGGEYLGLGVGAYSYLDGVRFGAPRDLDAYLSGKPLPTVDRETLSRDDLERERVLLSLRLAEGIDLAAYRRDFGRDPLSLFAPVTRRAPDHFRVTDTALALRGRGMQVSNTLIAECLLCLD